MFVHWSHCMAVLATGNEFDKSYSLLIYHEIYIYIVTYPPRTDEPTGAVLTKLLDETNTLRTSPHPHFPTKENTNNNSNNNNKRLWRHCDQEEKPTLIRLSWENLSRDLAAIEKTTYGDLVGRGKTSYADLAARRKTNYGDLVGRGKTSYGDHLARGKTSYGDLVARGKTSYVDLTVRGKISYVDLTVRASYGDLTVRGKTAI